MALLQLADPTQELDAQLALHKDVSRANLFDYFVSSLNEGRPAKHASSASWATADEHWRLMKDPRAPYGWFVVLSLKGRKFIESQLIEQSFSTETIQPSAGRRLWLDERLADHLDPYRVGQDYRFARRSDALAALRRLLSEQPELKL